MPRPQRADRVDDDLVRRHRQRPGRRFAPEARAARAVSGSTHTSHRRHGGRGAKRPGRSYWDEPELIRTLTRTRSPRHAPLPLRRGDHADGWRG
jgi:hypothetical protein